MKDRFRLMEEMDNKQISREIQGEVIDELVYCVEDKRHLSYAGVRYAASLLGGIHVKDVTCSYNEALDQFEATVYAENRNSGITMAGTAEHPTSQVVDSEQVRDMFARRTAVSKAARNALLAVMPVDHIKKVIEELQESTRVLESEAQIPETITPDSVIEYLKEFGAPTEDLEARLHSHRNVVKVRPTRFLGSYSWCAIDRAIMKIPGTSWLKEENRWEVPR